MAESEETKFEEAIQSMARCGVAEGSDIAVPHSRSTLSTKKWSWRCEFLLCYVRSGWNWNVSKAIPLIALDADDSSLVFAIVYWYIWTVAIPQWKGYRLEDEVEILKDGTTITKLVHVKHG
jgi:hypothetical protein